MSKFNVLIEFVLAYVFLLLITVFITSEYSMYEISGILMASFLLFLVTHEHTVVLTDDELIVKRLIGARRIKLERIVSFNYPDKSWATYSIFSVNIPGTGYSGLKAITVCIKYSFTKLSMDKLAKALIEKDINPHHNSLNLTPKDSVS